MYSLYVGLNMRIQSVIVQYEGSSVTDYKLPPRKRNAVIRWFEFVGIIYHSHHSSNTVILSFSVDQSIFIRSLISGWKKTLYYCNYYNGIAHQQSRFLTACIGASKISFIFYFWHKFFIFNDVKLTELFNSNSFQWKNVTFLWGDNILWPLLYIFRRSRAPTSGINTRSHRPCHKICRRSTFYRTLPLFSIHSDPLRHTDTEQTTGWADRLCEGNTITANDNDAPRLPNDLPCGGELQLVRWTATTATTNNVRTRAVNAIVIFAAAAAAAADAAAGDGWCGSDDGNRDAVETIRRQWDGGGRRRGYISCDVRIRAVTRRAPRWRRSSNCERHIARGDLSAAVRTEHRDKDSSAERVRCNMLLGERSGWFQLAAD